MCSPRHLVMHHSSCCPGMTVPAKSVLFLFWPIFSAAMNQTASSSTMNQSLHPGGVMINTVNDRSETNILMYPLEDVALHPTSGVLLDLLYLMPA